MLVVLVSIIIKKYLTEKTDEDYYRELFGEQEDEERERKNSLNTAKNNVGYKNGGLSETKQNT